MTPARCQTISSLLSHGSIIYCTWSSDSSSVIHQSSYIYEVEGIYMLVFSSFSRRTLIFGDVYVWRDAYLMFTKGEMYPSHVACASQPITAFWEADFFSMKLQVPFKLRLEVDLSSNCQIWHITYKPSPLRNKFVLQEHQKAGDVLDPGVHCHKANGLRRLSTHVMRGSLKKVRSTRYGLVQEHKIQSASSRQAAEVC